MPLGLVALFAAGVRFYDVPVADLPLVSARLAGALARGAPNAQVLSGPRLGDLLFTAAFNLMIFTVGWHYTKQVFGCMMVYAYFDGYPLTQAQRDLTKCALLSIWGMNFVYSNIGGAQNASRSSSYSSFDLPDIAGPLAAAGRRRRIPAGGLQGVLRQLPATGQRAQPNLLAPFVRCTSGGCRRRGSTSSISC